MKGNHLMLYPYTDELKTRFYILDIKKNIPEELLYREKLEDMQEQDLYIYRQQLSQFAIQCGAFTTDLQNKIQNVDYNETSLKKIISRINTNNENIATEANPRQKSISYFAGAGIMQAVIKYTGQDLITSDGLDANGNNKYKKITTTTLTPRIAAGMNFYSKMWLHRLGIKMELSAYRFASAIVSYTKYNNLTDAENQYTFHLSGWNVTVTPQLVYKFYTSPSIKAYLSSGVGFNVLITKKNSIYKLGLNQPLTFNETTEGYLQLRGFNLALTGRVGVLVKDKIDIYVYGNSPVEYNSSNPGDFSVKSGALAFCVAYQF